MKLGFVPLVLGVLSAFTPLYGGAEITVFLQPPDGHSRLAVKQMRSELERTLSRVDTELSWIDEWAANRSVEGRLVSVSLRGSCVGEPAAYAPAGPLGWAKVQDGRVLPYVEIDCDRVRAEISPEIVNQDSTFREVSLGRALGRVLAHELAHVMSRSLDHGDHGPTRRSFDSRDLLLGSMRLSAKDLRPTEDLRQRASAEPRPANRPEPGPAETDGR